LSHLRQTEPLYSGSVGTCLLIALPWRLGSPVSFKLTVKLAILHGYHRRYICASSVCISTVNNYNVLRPFSHTLAIDPGEISFIKLERRRVPLVLQLSIILCHTLCTCVNVPVPAAGLSSQIFDQETTLVMFFADTLHVFRSFILHALGDVRIRPQFLHL
jgi:hypothetical protein